MMMMYLHNIRPLHNPTLSAGLINLSSPVYIYTVTILGAHIKHGRGIKKNKKSSCTSAWELKHQTFNGYKCCFRIFFLSPWLLMRSARTVKTCL